MRASGQRFVDIHDTIQMEKAKRTGAASPEGKNPNRTKGANGKNK
jgi:hypothetical protein